MNSTEIHDMFRTEMSDVMAPYLWSDAEIYGFLDDAQTWFCRLTDGIADARTTAVTWANIVPGTDWYSTHDAIRQIRKITRVNDGSKIKTYTAEQADVAGIMFSPLLTGPIKGIVIGIEPHTFRVTPLPGSTTVGVLTVSSGITALGIVIGMGLTATGMPFGTTVLSFVQNTSVTVSSNATASMPLGTALAFGTAVNLSVYRFPLVTITEDGEQTLEIDTQHHTALLHWMKARAYDKQDIETFDRRKSDDFRERFTAYCARAQEEQQRARRVQGNVAYGGI
jgi:hypothetical protein